MLCLRLATRAYPLGWQGKDASKAFCGRFDALSYGEADACSAGGTRLAMRQEGPAYARIAKSSENSTHVVRVRPARLDGLPRPNRGIGCLGANLVALGDPTCAFIDYHQNAEVFDGRGRQMISAPCSPLTVSASALS